MAINLVYVHGGECETTVGYSKLNVLMSLRHSLKKSRVSPINLYIVTPNENHASSGSFHNKIEASRRNCECFLFSLYFWGPCTRNFELTLICIKCTHALLLNYVWKTSLPAHLRQLSCFLASKVKVSKPSFVVMLLQQSFSSAFDELGGQQPRTFLLCILVHRSSSSGLSRCN